MDGPLASGGTAAVNGQVLHAASTSGHPPRVLKCSPPAALAVTSSQTLSTAHITLLSRC